MSSLEELVASIEADKDAVAQLAGMIAAVKDSAEQVAGQLRQLGSESTAAQMESAQAVLEEAENGRVVLEGSLEKARWQVMSAVHGNLGPGAQGSGPGGSILRKERFGGPDGGPAPGGLDSVPPHVRQISTPSGEELMGADPSIGPFQKEHENAGADNGKSKAQRFGRSLVRNTGDAKDYFKTMSDSAVFKGENHFDPWGSSARTTTEAPVGSPPGTALWKPEAADLKASDLVGTTIVVAAIAIEGVSRFIRKKDHGK